MKILITGSEGLIGGALARRFGQFDGGIGNLVVGMDRRANNLDNGDVLLEDHWKAVGHADLIFHCASPVGPALAKAGWLEEIFLGTLHAVRFALEWKARLVVFSSPEVLGLGLSSGDMFTVGLPYTPRSEYQIGKIAAECLVMNSEVDAHIIRPSNVVGKGQRVEGGWVLARFVDQVRKGEELTVFGDGSQCRTFTSVHDLVDFCSLLVEKWPPKKIWNVASPFNRVSILSLAELVIRIASRGEIIHQDGRDVFGDSWNDVPEKLLSAGAALDLGWTPKWGLQEIIKEMLA